MDQYVTQGSESCPYSPSEKCQQPRKGENESNLLSPNDVLPAIDLGRKSSGCPLTTRHHLASHPFCHHRQVSPLEKNTKTHESRHTNTTSYKRKHRSWSGSLLTRCSPHHQHHPQTLSQVSDDLSISSSIFLQERTEEYCRSGAPALTFVFCSLHICMLDPLHSAPKFANDIKLGKVYPSTT